MKRNILKVTNLINGGQMTLLCGAKLLRRLTL